MNGFTKKSVGTLTLGEKLRKLRLDRRLSLAEVSRITKIQVKYLEYLEQGDYDHLPAEVYVRGFLRSYADFLGVDSQIFLRLYEKEKGIRKNIRKEKAVISPKPINISSFVFTPRKIMLAGIIILVFLGLFMLYRQIGSFSSVPRLIIFNPENNSRISGNSIYVEGITEKDASLFINGQPIIVNDEGRFRENLTLQGGLNVINIKAVNKFQKETAETVTVSSDFQAETGEKSDISGNENESLVPEKISLEIRVSPGPVWLSVEADGSLVFSGTMLSGSVQSFSATDKIIVNSGRGNATYLTFNGKEIGVLSEEPGTVRNVVFDKNTKY